MYNVATKEVWCHIFAKDACDNWFLEIALAVITQFCISSLSATKYHTPSYVVSQAHQYKLGAIFMAIAYLPRLCIPTPAALATYTQQLWLLLIPALRRPTGITCTTSVLIIPLHFRLLLGIDDILVVPHISLL